MEIQLWHLVLVAIFLLWCRRYAEEGYESYPVNMHYGLGYGTYPGRSYYPGYSRTNNCSKYRWIHGPGYYSTSPFGKDKKGDLYHSAKSVCNPVDYTKW